MTATVRTLTAYRDLMASLVRHHRGRVVDFTGDNLLAEFASVVDAVRCAVEIQEELRARNAELPDHRKMEFRIGINHPACRSTRVQSRRFRQVQSLTRILVRSMLTECRLGASQ